MKSIQPYIFMLIVLRHFVSLFTLWKHTLLSRHVRKNANIYMIEGCVALRTCFPGVYYYQEDDLPRIVRVSSENHTWLAH